MKKIINIRLIFLTICIAYMIGYSIYALFIKEPVQDEEPKKGTQVTDVSMSSGRFENILYENDKYICYDDKVVLKYNVPPENVQKIVDRVQGVVDRCPSLENIYVMPIPDLILLNDKMVEEQDAYAKYIEELNGKMPEKGKVVNVYPTLYEHKSEYIYFNTSENWTPRGAYYGMSALSEAMGLNLITLDKYFEYNFNSFSGGLVSDEELEAIPEVDDFKDRLFYYLYPNSNNEVEIVKKDDNGNIIRVKKPLITPSYRNTGMIISSNYLEAIVEGKSVDGNNEGKYLLVVCDDMGKMIIPVLKDYYDGIYVISVLRNNDLYHKINELTEKYNITDMLYVQKSETMGNEGYTLALNAFCMEMFR